MSFLPNFDYDIFISYSHIDNQPLTQGQRGWIDAFHQALEVRLAQLLGSDAEVFRDPELAGNDYYEHVLPQKLRRTAILISIVTPRYTQSEWCLRELRVFCEAAQATGGIRLGDKARIFKVVKMPVELDQHPPELQGLLGYDFYTRDADTGVPLELSPDMGDQARLKFIQKVNDLAYQIRQLSRELLHSFRGGGSETIVRRLTPRAGATVYLAPTTYDLLEARDAVRRELEQRGHTVLPDAEMPLGPAFRGFVQEQLGRAQMAVHPVGANYGVVPETERESIVALQIGLAAEQAAKNGLKQIVWMPVDLAPNDDHQTRFIAELERDERGFELLRTSLEELKTTVHDMLEHRAAAADVAALDAAGSRGPARIYLICDRQDVEAVRPIEDALFEAGYEVVLAAMEGDESQIREDHRENLLACDAVLLYYGQAGEFWLRAQLRELQKVPGYGRATPMLAKGILLASPAAPAKERFRTHEATVLRADGAPGLDALEPFLSQLRDARRAG